MDNINQTIPRRKRGTDSSRNHQLDSFARNSIQSQHQLQQRERQRERQHPQHRWVYNSSPNARASIQQFSNNHNYHPIPTRIPSYNSKVAGA